MKKVLIVDDNRVNRKLLLEILRKMDVEILEVENGVEALDICDLNPDISLVLMDINMPIMSGVESAILIKNSHPNISIISMTAYQAFGKIEEEDKKYFSEFITKPFTLDCIKDTVKKYCFSEN